MKAYPIIWNQPKKFGDHIIMIGTFHVVCAYFMMIGKKMEGTGLSDILVEVRPLVTTRPIPGPSKESSGFTRGFPIDM
jgi:hypothetical protein